MHFQKNFVFVSQQMVYSKQTYTVHEKRLLAFLLHHQSSDNLFNVQKLNVSAWSAFIDILQNGFVASRHAIFEGLLHKPVSFFNPFSSMLEEKILFKKATFEKGNLFLKLSPYAKDYFFSKDENSLGKFLLCDYVRLRSFYAQRLFELLMFYLSTNRTHFSISLKDLRVIFNLEDKTLIFRSFRNDVLAAAYKQIRTHTSLTYEWQGISISHKYVEIEFYNISS